MIYKNLIFVVTEKCNITCDFCGPNCSPDRKEFLDSAFMINQWKQFLEFALPTLVVFTGGEPFLYLDDVIETINKIKKDKPLTIIRIVSNGFWASSKARADQIVKRLKDAGVDELNFSVDDFHQKFISIDTIKNAVNSSLECGIYTLLAHKTFPKANNTISYYEKELERKIVDYRLCSRDDAKNGQLVHSSSNTIPIGRGSDSIEYEQWVDHPHFINSWKGPCDQVLKSIVIGADKKISPCCGLVERELKMFHHGNLVKDSLQVNIEAANISAIYNWLALEGPSSIKEMLAEKFPTYKFKERYVQNCHLCQEIFSNPVFCAAVKDDLIQNKTALLFKRSLHEAKRAADEA